MKNNEQLKSMLVLLSECPVGPHSDIDKVICEKLKLLSEKDEVFQADIKVLLDECVYGGLASAFGMIALEATMKMIQD